MITVEQATAEIKGLGPQATSVVKSAGWSMAGATAAYIVIPNTAVMSKQEIEDKVELSKMELFIRKAAVSAIIATLPNALKTSVAATKLFAQPGVESKLRATAKFLLATPTMYMAYKIIKRRIETGEGSLNIRDYTNKNKGTAAAIGAATALGYGQNMALNNTGAWAAETAKNIAAANSKTLVYVP